MGTAADNYAEGRLLLGLAATDIKNPVSCDTLGERFGAVARR